MAPRRTGRRIGMTRMDAALDAMIPLGFPTQIVQDKMNDLLKEYGGEDGYPFIEADAYKVLIDALLSGEEEESKQGIASTKVEVSGDERVGNHTVVTTAGLSSGSNDTPNMLLPTGRAEGDTNRQRDIVLDLAPGEEEGMDEVADKSDGSVEDMHLYCPSAPASQSTRRRRPCYGCRRRRPCYGWISDGDEDDNDLVYLIPATPSPTVQMDDLSNEAVRSSKRRSRWDM